MAINLRYLEVPDPVDRLSELDPELRRSVEHINQKVAGGTSLDPVMRFFFDSTRAICPSDRMSLAFIEENGRRAVARWSSNQAEHVRLGAGYTADIGGSSLEDVVRSGRPRIIDDLEAYLQEKPRSESTRLLVAEGMASSMGSPLLVEGRVVALLFCSSRRKKAYTDEHVRIHLALMERLAQTVEKARRIEELEAANRAYMEMLGFVSHELKSPLASMQMVGQTLLDGHFGELSSAQRDRIGRMNTKAEGLLSLVGEYLNLAWIESREMEIKPVEGVDLERDLVQPVSEELEPQRQAMEMRLDVDIGEGPVLVRCDPGLMRIVLRNLLGNAIKYGRRGGLISLQAERGANGLHLSVTNEGPGFPSEAQARLFKRFSRLDSPELKKRKGTGVGLYVSWRIVQAHGGYMRAESEPGAWARFHLHLPVST